MLPSGLTFAFQSRQNWSRQLQNDWLAFQRINRVWNSIVDAKESCSVNHQASISKRASAFSLISIGYLFIDLSSSTIEEVAWRVALEAATRKVFKITEFADIFCSLSIAECSDQMSRKIIKSTYPINSLERQPVILELAASDNFCRLWKAKFKTEHYFTEFYIS